MYQYKDLSVVIVSETYDKNLRRTVRNLRKNKDKFHKLHLGLVDIAQVPRRLLAESWMEIFLNHSTSNVSQKRNQIVRTAQTPCIMIMDAGDVISDSHIDNLLPCLVDPVIGATSGYDTLWGANKFLTTRRPLLFSDGRYLPLYNPVCHSGSIWLSSYLNYPDRSLRHDYALWISLARRKLFNIATRPEITVLRVSGPASLSSRRRDVFTAQTEVLVPLIGKTGAATAALIYHVVLLLRILLFSKIIVSKTVLRRALKKYT